MMQFKQIEKKISITHYLRLGKSKKWYLSLSFKLLNKSNNFFFISTISNKKISIIRYNVSKHNSMNKSSYLYDSIKNLYTKIPLVYPFTYYFLCVQYLFYVVQTQFFLDNVANISIIGAHGTTNKRWLEFVRKYWHQHLH